MIRLFFVFGFFLIVNSIPLFSQSENFLSRSYSAENDNLPTSLFKSSYRDREGFIWIGSDVGLLRYDGYQFQAQNGLPYNKSIKNITELNDSLFAYISDDGVVIGKTNEGVFSVVQTIKGKSVEDSVSVCFPKSIWMEEKDNYWIGEPGSLVHWVSGKITRYHFPESERANNYFRGVQFLAKNKNHLYFVTQRGSFYEYNNQTISKVTSPLPETVEVDVVKSLPEYILLGTNKGIFKVSYHTNPWTAELIISVPQISDLIAFGNRIIFSTWFNGVFIAEPSNHWTVRRLDAVKYQNIHHLFYRANSNKIFISADEGFEYTWQPEFIPFLLPESPNSFIIASTVAENGIYTTNGYAVYHLEKEKKTQIIFQKKSSFITSLLYNHNILYIAYRDGFIDMLNTSNHQVKQIRLPNLTNRRLIENLTIDNNQTLWMTISSSLVLGKYQLNHSSDIIDTVSLALQPSDHFNKILKLKNGNLLLGGSGKNRYLFDFNPNTETGSNISFLNKSIPNKIDSTFQINDMTETDHGVYLATSHGLLLYNNRRLSEIVHDHSSVSSDYQSIVSGNDGSIWLGSENGIVRHYGDEFVYYKSENGLLNTTSSGRTIVIDQSNNLWFGSAKGVFLLTTKEEQLSKSRTPHVIAIRYHSEKLNINDLDIFENIEQNKTLEFELSNLNFPGERTTYQLKLLNYSDQWVSLKRTNKFIFPNISYGKYVLQIRSQSSGRLLSDILTIPITVIPYWYETTAFKISILLFLTLLGFFVYKYVNQRQSKRETELKLLEAEKQAIELIRLLPESLIRMTHGKVTYYKVGDERLFNSDIHEKANQFKHGLDLKNVVVRELHNHVLNFYLEILQNPAENKITKISLTTISSAYELQSVILNNVDVFIVIRDVTKQNEIEKSLISAREKAQEASKLKSEFLAVVSHEIRTPLNGIIGMTNLVLQTPLNDEQIEYTKIISQSGQVLLNLVNDILDFSKIESGKTDLTTTTVDLIALLEGIVEPAAIKALSNHSIISYMMSQNFPVMTIGDPYRIRQVLTNLIDNAIKFTTNGVVFIYIDSVRSNNKPTQYCRIRICDTGIGIPEDKMNRLFKPFSQIDSSNIRKYGGTGLGLAISKQLAHLMKGDIVVRSTEGKGTVFTFTFEIPTFQATPIIPKKNRFEIAVKSGSAKLKGVISAILGVTHVNLNHIKIYVSEKLLGQADNDPTLNIVINNHKQEPRIKENLLGIFSGNIISRTVLETSFKYFDHSGQSILESNSNEKPQTFTVTKDFYVLIAEDNVINQRVISKSLERLGLQPFISENGYEVLEFVNRNQNCLIFMDIQMPLLDGVSTTKQIRALYKEKPIIIALTANIFDQNRQECLDAGMNDFLSKPFTFEDMKLILTKYLPKG